jgi:four helix bundle suffix protein
MTDGFIPPHGGYRDLISYRKAEIVYDATVSFCERFLERRDRTVDQMVQAARSGKQNIVEGSMASGTSKEMEIKLMNVARASLEELLADYLDFLRVRQLALWDKNSKAALTVRKLARQEDRSHESHESDGSHTSHESHESYETHRSHKSHESYETYRTYIETRSPETVANIIICLIHQANYLLDRQIRQLERAFLKEGGLRERMTRARLEERDRQRNRKREGGISK